MKSAFTWKPATLKAWLHSHSELEHRVWGRKRSRPSSLWKHFLNEQLQGIPSFYITSIYSHVCVHIHRVCVESEDNLQESFLSFPCMCPRNQTEAVIPDGKRRYPFSHLAIPGRNNFLTQKNLSKEPIFKLTRKACISECPLSLGGHYSLLKLSHNI